MRSEIVILILQTVLPPTTHNVECSSKMCHSIVENGCSMMCTVVPVIASAKQPGAIIARF
jgi:hypothetical protein